jgi:hypothetical protein
MESPLDFTRRPVLEMSVTDWLIIYLIMAIPIVNIVMLFVWAFGSNTKSTHQKWAKGNLIVLAIFLGIYMFFLFTIGIGYLFNA